ncbi:MAG: phage baseplate assembly protein V [Fretibacterium sp.]|nr:phage baseplate assembly protein V [Fretibacterium sp.]
MPNEGTEPGAVARFGYVSVYDPKRHMARVRFPDKGDVVSGWLPVTVPNTKRNKDERPLDVGEHVFCVMMGNGLEAGAILGAVYDDTNKPPIGDGDIRATTYADGTRIKVDRKSGLVAVSAVGDVDLDGSMIYLN